MAQEPTRLPNPLRVAAGRRNRLKRKELTEDGRQRLRAAALHHQPWRYATGPRTPTGKARSALNGKRRQVAELSVREVRRELAGLDGVIDRLAEIRRGLFDSFE